MYSFYNAYNMVYYFIIIIRILYTQVAFGNKRVSSRVVYKTCVCVCVFVCV